MTPQEIFEYKTKWLSAGGHAVKLHSDLDVEGKLWCRRNVERHQWSFIQYTDLYEHTFLFENQDTSKQFEKEFEKWLTKNQHKV
jgi:hypothetical protein